MTPLVLDLLGTGSPTAIAWFVVPVIVNSVKF